MTDKKSAQQRGIEKVQEIMVDTRFDRLRTASAKRALATLAACSIVAAPVLYWFEDQLFLGAGALGVLILFTNWWLLRLSVRLVADAPDEALDEFQVHQRDRNYLDAYRALALVMSLLAVGIFIFVIATDVASAGKLSKYELSFTFSQVNALIWLLLGPTVILPNLTLAWRQAKRSI